MKSKKVTTEKLKEEEKKTDIESIITKYLLDVKTTEEMVADTIKKGYMNPELAANINASMEALYEETKWRLISQQASKNDRDRITPWKINMKPKEETPLPYMS